jgi:hypothetical protein
VAGSSPGLVAFCEANGIDIRVAGLQAIYENPKRSSIWKNFTAISQLDKKWEFILRYICTLEQGHKSMSSGPNRKNKMLLGAKLPVIALLYAILSTLAFAVATNVNQRRAWLDILRAR